jgi:hypothetical protein
MCRSGFDRVTPEEVREVFERPWPVELRERYLCVVDPLEADDARLHSDQVR